MVGALSGEHLDIERAKNVLSTWHGGRVSAAECDHCEETAVSAAERESESTVLLAYGAVKKYA